MSGVDPKGLTIFPQGLKPGSSGIFSARLKPCPFKASNEFSAAVWLNGLRKNGVEREPTSLSAEAVIYSALVTARLKPCPFTFRANGEIFPRAVKDAPSGIGLVRESRVVSLEFVAHTQAKNNRGFFAHHPQTEKRLGPRSLRMTAENYEATAENYEMTAENDAMTAENDDANFRLGTLVW